MVFKKAVHVGNLFAMAEPQQFCKDESVKSLPQHFVTQGHVNLAFRNGLDLCWNGLTKAQAK